MSLVISPILSERSINEESTVRSKARKGPRESAVKERSKWSYYHKPITLVVFGALVFLVGILYTMFYFTKYVDVPYALGPVFISIGLMFLVTGLVWLPVVKEAIRQKGVLRKINGRRTTVT